MMTRLPGFRPMLDLVLLHQEIFRRMFLAIGAVQHGHRGNLLTRAAIGRRRMVAIEFGMCRSGRGKVGGLLTQLKRKKIDDGGFETPYRSRKQVVEPVFGKIKQARGFRQFLLRGVNKVRAEWAMICTTHNLLKLFTLA